MRPVTRLTLGYVSPVASLDQDERKAFFEAQRRVREFAGERPTKLELRMAMWEGVAKEVWR